MKMLATVLKHRLYIEPPNIHTYINMYMGHRGLQSNSTEAGINFL